MDGGVVDVSGAGTRIWLVKVPDFVAERLETEMAGREEGDEMEVGGVRIYEGTPTSPPRVMVHLSLPGNPVGEYHLHFCKCPAPMHLMATAGEDCQNALLIGGRVEQECILRPVMNDAYRRLMAQRRSRAETPRRKTMAIDSTRAAIQPGLLQHVPEHKLLVRRMPDEDGKRERLPRQDLQDLLFRSFDAQSHWTLKALGEALRQPTVYLKEVLNEIAVYNQRGPYKNTFQLKPEFTSRK